MSSKTIVLISGANQGLGFEIAKKLATEQRDYHILLGSRDLAKGEESAKKLQGLPASIQAVQLDITSDESINACAALIERHFARLDVLINNAEIATPAYGTERTPRKKLAKCFDPTNPRIVFMGSEMGSVTHTLDPHFAYYGVDSVSYKASKAALNMIAATYAVKYGKEGFKVNICCPGLRKTNLSPAMGSMGGPASEGAINACKLATLEEDGENGTFTNTEDTLPW